MRTTITIAAALLLLSMASALPGSAVFTKSYEGTISVSGDGVASPAWWDSYEDPPVQALLRLANALEPTGTEPVPYDEPVIDEGNDSRGNDREAPVWLRVDDLSDAAVVSATVSQNVVGSIDVYEAHDPHAGHAPITPECPQDLLQSVLPGDDGIFTYLVRVNRLTLGSHAVATPGSAFTETAHLQLPVRDEGYVVVFDIRANAGSGSLDYRITSDRSLTVVDENQKYRPLDPEPWLLHQDHRDHCVDRLASELPSDPLSGSSPAAEVPGVTEGLVDVEELLQASLPS